MSSPFTDDQKAYIEERAQYAAPHLAAQFDYLWEECEPWFQGNILNILRQEIGLAILWMQVDELDRRESDE